MSPTLARVVTSPRPVGSDSVIVVYLAFVRSIAPSWFGADIVCGTAFQLPFVKIDNITSQLGVILQRRPRQRMISVSNAEEAAKRP